MKHWSYTMTDQQNYNLSKPIRVRTLDVCASDYFQGHSGPTLHVGVDARTTARELFDQLTNHDEWPQSLDDATIEGLVTEVIGALALEHDTRLFPDVYPEEEPPYELGVVDIFVVEQEDACWAVIDGLDHATLYTEDTYGAAVCAAWDYYASAGFGDRPTDVYAYFGLALDLPDGYDVRTVYGDNPSLWEFVLLDEDGSPLSNGESTDGYSSEFDARLAAWQDKLRSTLGEPTTDEVLVMDRHAYLESVCESALRGLSFASTEEQFDRELDKLSLAVSRLAVPIVGTYDDATPPRWTEGLVERDTPDDYPGAGINDGSWMSRVVVYGTDEQDATNLRGVILDALCNRSDVGQSLDDEPTDAPRKQPAPPVKADMGQITDVWHEDWVRGDRRALRGYVVARDSGYVWFCDVSGTRHTFVEADITYMEPRPEPARDYCDLHDGLSALIEGGRITPDTMEERDYQWLVDSLAAL